MARTAIISDIHANYHALCAVVDDVRAMQCTDMVFLGDVVGYNAFPSECLDYVRDLNCPVVRGNHDEEVFAPSLAKMNPIARQAMDWTRQQLRPDQLEWLGHLQYQRIVRTDAKLSFSIVHASLDQPKAWNYVLDAADAALHFMRQVTPICFHGHSHVPRIFISNGHQTLEDMETLHRLYLEGYTEFQPQPGLKYLINVGSVGQPRDADARSCYAIFDTDLHLIILKRVSYDVAAAQRAVLAAGLPSYLAERLSSGA